MTKNSYSFFSNRINGMDRVEKKPQQERSKARVEKILEVAGELLREAGYESLSTKQIASRAGVPIGTIYQFFSNRDAVVEALVARFQQDIGGLTQELAAFEPHTQEELSEFIGRLVDGIADIQARSAGFVCLFAGSAVNEKFEAMAGTLRQSLNAQIDRALRCAAPGLHRQERSQTLVTLAEITRGIIARFDRAKPGQRAALIEELKLVLNAYLGAKLAKMGKN